MGGNGLHAEDDADTQEDACMHACRQTGQAESDGRMQKKRGHVNLVSGRSFWPVWSVDTLRPLVAFWPWGSRVSLRTHSRGSWRSRGARHSLTRLEIHHRLVLGQQHLVVAVVNGHLVQPPVVSTRKAPGRCGIDRMELNREPNSHASGIVTIVPMKKLSKAYEDNCWVDQPYGDARGDPGQ